MESGKLLSSDAEGVAAVQLPEGATRLGGPYAVYWPIRLGSRPAASSEASTSSEAILCLVFKNAAVAVHRAQALGARAFELQLSAKLAFGASARVRAMKDKTREDVILRDLHAGLADIIADCNSLEQLMVGSRSFEAGSAKLKPPPSPSQGPLRRAHPQLHHCPSR